ncbi:MAG: hypothetical protein JNM40_22260 [Myxococcales bacterium]|nr:hypothetical protein [Myxococcales bacterium]
MVRRERYALVFLGAALAGAGLLLLSEPPDPPPPKPNPTPKPVLADDSYDDETALARMLRSEDDDNTDAQAVIGWLTIQTARRRKQSIYQRITDGRGYGPRVLDGKSRYADTRKPPNERTRKIARKLLNGEILPSEQIRNHPTASWVERARADTNEAAAVILRRQKSFGRIWGRIAGTRWYLFDEALKPPLDWTPATARKVLASVPILPATEA